MPLCTASHPQSDSARIPEVEGPLPASSSICWSLCVSQNLLGSQASCPRGQVTSSHLAWRQMEGTGWKTWHRVGKVTCYQGQGWKLSAKWMSKTVILAPAAAPHALPLTAELHSAAASPCNPMHSSYTGWWHHWLPRWCMSALTRKFQEKYCSILETSAFASMFSNNRATLVFSTGWDLTCNIVYFPVNFLSYVW